VPSWIVKFIPLALIWGSSFLFIELSLELTTALGVAFWRTALGAAAMAIIMAFLRVRFPNQLKQWLHLWLAGFLMSALPFSLYAFAQQSTTSILAAIINATTPLFTLLSILTLFRAQRQSSTAVMGLLIGIVGVAITLGVWQGFGENDPVAILALILASISYGRSLHSQVRHSAGITGNVGCDGAGFHQCADAAAVLCFHWTAVCGSPQIGNSWSTAAARRLG